MLTKLKGKKLVRAINLVAGLAILFFGYDQGMMSGVNISPDYVRRMKIGDATYEGQELGWVSNITNPTKQGGIVSIYYFGTLLGAIWAGVMGDKIGRIRTMLFGTLFIILGAALQASAMNAAWMCCARTINGVGTGFLNAIVPVWSAEVASHTSRGAFIAMEFTLNIFGVVLAYWIEFGLSYVDEGNSQVRWRFPIAFQLVPVTMFVISVWFMPESPRWLAKVGRTSEARTILAALRADGNEDDPYVIHEYTEILEVVALEKANHGRSSYISMLFGTGWGELHVARRVQLSVWLQIIQEWVGIAAVTVYSPTMFSQAGYDNRKSDWLSGLNMITYMISTLGSVVTIDRFGRRWGLWVGAVVQGIAMFLAGGFSRLTVIEGANGNEVLKSRYGAAGAFFIFLYTSAFGATWLEIPWVYPTETFPLEVRAKGNAWGVIGWSIGNGWLTLLNPVMFSSIKENTLHVFGAVNFLSIPLVWAFYPETANRTLEEVDLLFASDSLFVWDNEKVFAERKGESDKIVVEKRPSEMREEKEKDSISEV